MIRIEFDQSALTDAAHAYAGWWQNWLPRSAKATSAVIANFETWLAGPRTAPFTSSFNSQIWKDLKDWWMANIFFDKCAYCECEISGYYGDAEHFRPKAAVKHRIDPGKERTAECEVFLPFNQTVIRIPHPGYFWLAYDYRNLVPACAFCNAGEGKGARFDIQNDYRILIPLTPAELAAIPPPDRPFPSPTWPGYFYPSPALLNAQELPLLLNPLNPEKDANPRSHIVFGVRGIEAPRNGSARGLRSIEVYKLDSEKLRKRRQKAQEEFRSGYFDAMRRNQPEFDDAKQFISEYRQGRHPFSAACLDYHRILYDEQPKPLDP